MLKSGGFNVTKFVKNEVNIFKHIEMDVTFAEPFFQDFSEVIVWALAGTQKQTQCQCWGLLSGNISNLT